MRMMFVFAALSLVASNAFAQTSEDTCQESYTSGEAVFSLLQLSDQTPSRIEIEDGWCISPEPTELSLGGTENTFTIENLAWRGTAPNEDGGAFYVKFALHPNSGAIGQSMPGQSVRSLDATEVALMVLKDTSSSPINLMFTIDLPRRNKLSLSARSIGLNVSSQIAFEASLASASLEQFSITIESDGRIERAWSDTYGELPELSQNDRALAQAWVAGAPSTLMSPNTRDQAQRLLNELPNLRGTWIVSLDTPNGLSAINLVQMAPSFPDAIKFAEMLPGATIDVSFRP